MMIRLQEKLYSFLFQDLEGRGILRTMWDTKHKVFSTFNTAEKSEDDLYALFSVWGRPWFNRVWIIKELLNTRTSYFACGDDSMASEPFLYFSYLVNNSVSLRMTKIRNEAETRRNVGQLAEMKYKGAKYIRFLTHYRSPEISMQQSFATRPLLLSMLHKM